MSACIAAVFASSAPIIRSIMRAGTAMKARPGGAFGAVRRVAVRLAPVSSSDRLAPPSRTRSGDCVPLPPWQFSSWLKRGAFACATRRFVNDQLAPVGGSALASGAPKRIIPRPSADSPITVLPRSPRFVEYPIGLDFLHGICGVTMPHRFRIRCANLALPPATASAQATAPLQ
ncbi:MAG TPA: hypothetical protein VNE67_09130 [Acetobacteraceae bacterium]|nr:hypothetical protein [Acetobacteraceae bacterium]